MISMQPAVPPAFAFRFELYTIPRIAISGHFLPRLAGDTQRENCDKTKWAIWM